MFLSQHILKILEWCIMHSRSSQERSRGISENAAGKRNSCEREEQGESCNFRLKKARTSRIRNASMLTWYQFSNGFALRPTLLTVLCSCAHAIFPFVVFSPHGLVRYVINCSTCSYSKGKNSNLMSNNSKKM